MNFKLDFQPQPPARLLNYRQPILLTGSCFSENIAERLSKSAFNIVAQPAGTVFNPLSITGFLKRIRSGERYSPNDLLYYNELWHSWDHHGSFSGTGKEEVLHRVNNAFDRARDITARKDAVLIITLGSALVYQLKNEPYKLVANCHKYPQVHFTKRFLDVAEIVSAFDEIISSMGSITIYFTVSPVRHVRDGLVQNNLGKAILLQAVHELCVKHSNCYYFPAYEIVIDELRDHRFYNADMIHPNEQAIEYVWQQFVNTTMDLETKRLVKDMNELNNMLQHQVKHTGTASQKRFEEAIEKKRKEVQNKYQVAM